MDRLTEGSRSGRDGQALLDHLLRLEKYRDGRMAVEIHLSRLTRDNSQDHHLRIALSVLRSSLQGLEGATFVCANTDLFFVGHKTDSAAVRKAVEKQRHLFKDDPLIAAGTQDRTRRFVSTYDLKTDYQDVLRHVRAIVVEEDRQLAERRRQERMKESKQAGATRHPLDLGRLARLEKVLASADISNLIRQQPVCAIAGDMMPKRVLVECFTSIDDLERVLMPGTDMARNRGLFQYLTQILDNRMLAYLKHDHGHRFEHYFSVNLNVASVLSPAFLNFDSNLPVGSRGTVVLELQQPDVFADLKAFAFARDFVKERGYRICLDGVTRESIAFVDPEKMGIDLVKLHWHDDLPREVGNGAGAEFREALARIGTEHIILHRCESEDAVQFGQSMGIPMFQGHHVDALLPVSERASGRSALAN